MATLHDVLRYLLERVPHSTQDDHDRVAAIIDEHEQDHAEAAPARDHEQETGAAAPEQEEQQS